MKNKTKQKVLSKGKAIYCVHDWTSYECGSCADDWRECERCNTRWDSLSTKSTGSWFWPWEVGVYGKEPKTVIAKVNR